MKVVTTRWDDGDVNDLRLAELLFAYGVKGTFYVPLRCDTVSLMNAAEIRSLRNAGFEIGSHGLTHTPLPAAAEPERELSESRLRLEDMLGEPILAFCYPLGRFSRRSAILADQAGYRLARTTVGFRTANEFDCFRPPVSLQFYPHSRKTLFKHELRSGNLDGIQAWMRRWSMKCDPHSLASAMLEDTVESGGVFHVWGHSWEIDRYDLWSELEDLLKLISKRPAVSYCTNLELLDR